ncbi:TolC family protein [Sphingobacterium sp. BIGb0165]|uniref:TolC family protein n=1 Tax=Sphingobacterium sp. BIGb0165 TaxID=2940615 RepID=UPI002168C4B5|nr:TolC family protein [Sphingobacterium sp. BIGb0165]MCS4224289.1 NodT family efflux transporter outer membrane factor (OMF) lipoprotein [Sphingobacterium sp. BIGb0165]
MIKKISMGALLLFNLTSCIGYKNATPEKIEELKNTSAIKANVEISDKWMQERSENQPDFSYAWMNELLTPELEALIKEGLAHNADIIISKEKLNQVELAMDIAGSSLYPSVNALANTGNNLVSGSHIGKLQLKANWELDLWGKNKSAEMASVSQYFSATFQQKMLEQSVAGMIAKAYYLNIAGQYQEQKISEYITKTEDLKRILTVQNKVGTANVLDLSNIESESILLSSYLEKIKNANSQSRRSLETLCGKYPEGLIKVSAKFSALQQHIPTNFPLNVLEKRADIMAQQFQIESSFYEIREAKAARLPAINISAAFGAAETNVEGISNLFSNPLIKVGGGLTTPIFNGGKLKKNVEVKTSQQKQAVEQYAKSVLLAFNEVESALANLGSIEKQEVFQQQAISSLEKNIDLTRKQIKIGSSNSFTLLQKQRDLVKREMNNIDLHLQQRIERINLYMALGANGLANF